MKLGVNIDHIATLREARAINEPDPLQAVFIAKEAGADQITIHLREDRRHIDDFDLKRVIESAFLPVNVECSINPQIVDLIASLKPQRVTIVPEKREEVTTEGGLDVAGGFERVRQAVQKFQENDVSVSLFIDPTIETIDISKELGIQYVELHTGHFANIFLMLHTNLRHTKHSIKELELPREILQKMLRESLIAIQESARRGKKLGLEVAAGHGLNYQNVHLIRGIEEIFELNIGHSIIAKSVFVGLKQAILDMKNLLI